MLLFGRSFIPTNLDYCNSVLNYAARIVANLPRFSQVSWYMLEMLYWLPVDEMIKFKILLVGRSSIVVEAQEYTTNLCVHVSSPPYRS